MSHNIRYSSYPEKVNKQSVQSEWDEYVRMEDWQEGAGGLARPIRWLDQTIYESYDEAKQAIERLDNHWYDQLAVKYYEHETDKDDSKLKDLIQASDEAMHEYMRRDRAIYPQTLQAALITCKKCGSKLAKSYLKRNTCPVCSEELRPEHILKSIQAAKDKWDRRQKDIGDYKKKHSKKHVRWLVKIEYHT